MSVIVRKRVTNLSIPDLVYTAVWASFDGRVWVRDADDGCWRSEHPWLKGQFIKGGITMPVDLANQVPGKGVPGVLK